MEEGRAMWRQFFLVLILLSKSIFSYQPNDASKKRSRTSHFAGGFGKASKQKKPATAVTDQRQNPSQVVRYVTKNGSGASVIANHCPTFNMLYPGIRAVHSDPPIFEIDNFFSKTVCESYISRSLVGTEIVCQPLAGSEDTRRTSQTRYLKHAGAMEIIEAAQKLTGITSEKFEEPQVVRYLPGNNLQNSHATESLHIGRIGTEIFFLSTNQLIWNPLSVETSINI